MEQLEAKNRELEGEPFQRRQSAADQAEIHNGYRERIARLNREIALVTARLNISHVPDDVGLLWYLAGRLHPKPAKIEIAATLTEEQIADRLAGTQDSEPIKAILALLGARVIRLSDGATDAPRSEQVTRDGVIPAFTNDERLHLAGGAAYLAEILGELQDLVKPRPIEKPKEIGA